MKHACTFVSATLTAVLLVGGCPIGDSDDDQSGIDAQIGISATSGDPPLRVVVSGAESTSENGSIVSYSWNFGDEASADTVTAEHTFEEPGRYAVTLTVVDSAGEEASAGVYVRIRGGEVTAVITANQVSGPAPLAVQFDGSESTAVDDTILDYYWDFGDGEESRLTAPFHVFEVAGTYPIDLRVVSAGGVEGSTEATVTVGSAADASLQFNGSQYADLPVTSGDSLSELTFETWCNPDEAGGTLVSFGTPSITIEVTPDVGITVESDDESYDVAASVTSGQWQHVALSYASDDGATVYLDGSPVGTVPLSGEFDVTLLSLGSGFQGKAAEVRFWSVSRDETSIADDMEETLTGYEQGLLGDWALDDGSGQTLDNNAAGGEDGTRGSSEDDETADPAWSSDSP